MNSKSQSNMAMAFMAGLTAGSVLAMLFAPKSGEETRAELKDKMDKAKGMANDVMAKTRGKVNESMDAATEAAQDMADKVQRKAGRQKAMLGRIRDSESSPTDRFNETTVL